MATMASELFIPAARPADAVAWRAVEERDARYDGRFVYAVRSTRVYCRPSCPSRRPGRSVVTFFDAPLDAERAGYRACRRCHPRSLNAGSTTAAVARARAHLDARSGSGMIPLAELAAHTGLSAHHLQRSFKRILGVSPKEYQDAHRAERFKARLRGGDTVSRATYEAGYGSSSRVYERADALLGMTPAAFRRGGAGMRIAFTVANSPVGRVLVGLTDRGVCSVMLGRDDAELERTLRAEFPRASIERGGDSHAWVHAVLDRIQHPENESRRVIPLDVDGTVFQWQVWKALQSIPAGERRSYHQVAAAIGRPSASRAVARACATNRVAVVIPCHRVVRSDGELGGYRWGTDRKTRLLDREGGGRDSR